MFTHEPLESHLSHICTEHWEHTALGCQLLKARAFLGTSAGPLSWVDRRKKLANIKPGLLSAQAKAKTLTSAQDLFATQSCGARTYNMLNGFFMSWWEKVTNTQKVNFYGPSPRMLGATMDMICVFILAKDDPPVPDTWEFSGRQFLNLIEQNPFGTFSFIILEISEKRMVLIGN